MQRISALASKSLLQKAILANAVFCTASAVISATFARPLAQLMGLSSPTPLYVLAAILLLYAPMLLKAAADNPVRRLWAWTIIGLDILWVAGSLAVIFTNWVPLSIPGKWTVAIIADFVAPIAVAQYVGLRKQRQ